MSWRASAAAAVLATAAGFSALWLGTDGGTAWTAESARRLAVLENPQPLPAARLRDAHGHALSLTGFERPLVLMDFIYTTCPAACVAMGAAFRQLQRDLATLGLQDDVRLLSLTFDQAHDGAAELADYLTRFAADEAHWSAAKFEDPRALDAVLKQLGVVVIPAPDAGFVHNAAIYLAHRGQVVGIYDFDDRAALLEEIAWRLTPG